MGKELEGGNAHFVINENDARSLEDFSHLWTLTKVGFDNVHLPRAQPPHPKPPFSFFDLRPSQRGSVRHVFEPPRLAARSVQNGGGLAKEARGGGREERKDVR